MEEPQVDSKNSETQQENVWFSLGLQYKNKIRIRLKIYSMMYLLKINKKQVDKFSDFDDFL